MPPGWRRPTRRRPRPRRWRPPAPASGWRCCGVQAAYSCMPSPLPCTQTRPKLPREARMASSALVPAPRPGRRPGRAPRRRKLRPARRRPRRCPQGRSPERLPPWPARPCRSRPPPRRLRRTNTGRLISAGLATSSSTSPAGVSALALAASSSPRQVVPRRFSSTSAPTASSQAFTSPAAATASARTSLKVWDTERPSSQARAFFAGVAVLQAPDGDHSPALPVVDHQQHGLQAMTGQVPAAVGRPADLRHRVVGGVLERHLQGHRRTPEGAGDMPGRGRQVPLARCRLRVAVLGLEGRGSAGPARPCSGSVAPGAPRSGPGMPS